MLAAASTVRRAGLEALLKKAPLLELAGSLHSPVAVAQYAAQLHPDVLLLDLENEHQSIGSPGGPGLPQIINSVPAVTLIDEPSADWTAHALRSGVRAILPRDSGLEEILAGVQAAHSGLVLLDPGVTLNLTSRIPTQAGQPAAGFDDLTAREIEVLRMLAEGTETAEIAQRLNYSERTIKNTIYAMQSRLGLRNRTHAVAFALRRAPGVFV